MDTKRNAPINLDSTEFRKLGHELIDSIADFLQDMSHNPVTTGKSPAEARKLLKSQNLPEEGV